MEQGKAAGVLFGRPSVCAKGACLAKVMCPFGSWESYPRRRISAALLSEASPSQIQWVFPEGSAATLVALLRKAHLLTPCGLRISLG